jgi:uncharacterized membrane protein
MRTQSALKFASLLLAAVGFAVSAHLLARHFALAGAAVLGADFCSVLFGSGCDETLRSAWAVQAGLPLAGWGLVYYTTLVSLLSLGWSIGSEFEFPATLAALLLATVAAVLSLALLVLMLSGYAPFCPLCVIVHIVNLLLVLPLRRLVGGATADLARSVAVAGSYFLGRHADNPPLARWRLLGFFTTALIAVVVYQWVYVEYALVQSAAASDFDAAETLKLYEQIRPQEIAFTGADAQAGDPASPVRLIVFSDFQCPGCTRFAKTLADLRNRFQSMHVVFKHFPLSSTCNPLIRSEPHPWPVRRPMRRRPPGCRASSGLFMTRCSPSTIRPITGP